MVLDSVLKAKSSSHWKFITPFPICIVLCKYFRSKVANQNVTFFLYNTFRAGAVFWMNISKLKIPKSTYFLKTVFRKFHYYQFTIEVSNVAVEAMSLGNLLFALIKKIVSYSSLPNVLTSCQLLLLCTNQPNLLEKHHWPLDKYCLDSVVLVIFSKMRWFIFTFLQKKNMPPTIKPQLP